MHKTASLTKNIAHTVQKPAKAGNELSFFLF